MLTSQQINSVVDQAYLSREKISNGWNSRE